MQIVELKRFAPAAKHTMLSTDAEEDLSYSAKRLTQVWPKRFPTIESAAPYAHTPEALANKVYGGRMGNTEPGDGWKIARVISTRNSRLSPLFASRAD